MKERNSDSVKYSFYCTVKITGEQIEKDDTINWTDIYYNITSIDDFGNGTLVFSEPIDMAFLEKVDPLT